MFSRKFLEISSSCKKLQTGKSKVCKGRVICIPYFLISWDYPHKQKANYGWVKSGFHTSLTPSPKSNPSKDCHLAKISFAPIICCIRTDLFGGIARMIVITTLKIMLRLFTLCVFKQIFVLQSILHSLHKK